MNEDEAALLAELKAISNKSASSRFDGQQQEEEPKPEPEAEPLTTVESPQKNSKSWSSPVRSALGSFRRNKKMRDSPTGSSGGGGSAPNSPSMSLWKRKTLFGRKDEAEETTTTTEAQGSAPSTFVGERGGDAEDAELLALLKGVSSKASDRFGGSEDEAPPLPEPSEVAKVSPKPSTKPSKDSFDSKKPWQRKGLFGRKKQEADVVVAEPPRNETQGYGIKSDIPSSFSGERGGAAEDAELLALLRGVSKKASDRFGNDDDDPPPVKEPKDEPLVKKVPPASPVSKPKISITKPWKRKPMLGRKKEEKAVEVVAPQPPKEESRSRDGSQGYGIKSDIPSTFAGERGGAAQDTELLALLRGVSSKSSDRFDEGDQAAEEKKAEPQPVSVAPVEPPKSTAKESPSTKPWKRKGLFGTMKQEVEPEGMVSGPPPPPEDSGHCDESGGYGIKSDIPSSFSGERGGAAEDAELLALLRGVSNKASDRFASDYNTAHPESSSFEAPAKVKPENRAATRSKVKSDVSKTWKRKSLVSKKESAPEMEVVVASPQNEKSNRDEANGYGIKSDMPSCFSGERGGAAEDAELLALLRGVSNKGANRFDDDNKNEASSQNAPEQPPQAPSVSSAVKPWKMKKVIEMSGSEESYVMVSNPRDETTGYGIKSDTKSTFSGERGGSAEDAELLAMLRGVSNKASDRFNDAERSSGQQQADETVTESSSRLEQIESLRGQPAVPSTRDESAGYGLKAETPSTFSGERGGAAEDAELLALLRGVSSKRSDRFEVRTQVQDGVSSLVQDVTTARAPVMEAPTSLPGLANPGVEETISIDIGDFPDVFKDRNWKIRSAAYDFICTRIESLAGEEGQTEDAAVHESLSDVIPNFALEAQVSALDKALKCLTRYAELCIGARDATQAGAIATSLLKKNALSSRPSTFKLATGVALKLMEVGDTVSSLHTLVNIFLEHGLSAKKPKVVLSSTLILAEAMTQFGVGNFPLASLTESLPKFIAHSNVKVREAGMQITAELCRVLPNRSPIQGVLDGLKKAQSAQLEKMIETQPGPTPIGTGLKCMKTGGEASNGATQLDMKELEQQQYAARPAVDLLEAISKTDYSQRLQQKKWSEKVAAMKTIMECAGKEPYKLQQPSSSSSYAALIGEMKQLLSHTHFAVCNNAMIVLGMLASGVGEKLFPNLRPLLSPLLQLSKDKKLTKGVSKCLDSFFGNVLSFNHLVEDDGGLNEALDERKQRNALARTCAMEFLSRCLSRREDAGPRGKVTKLSADKILSLFIAKTADSDASVRKACLEAMKTVVACTDDETVKRLSNDLLEDLKKSNPRVLKTINGAAITNQGKELSAKPSTNRKVSESKSEAKIVPTSRSSETLSQPHQHSIGDKADVSHPALQDALELASALNIPNWSLPPEDGGVLKGLQSSKWQERQKAIESFALFFESGEVDNKEADSVSSAILTITKEYTRDFKETNINIVKSIIRLTLAICGFHVARSTEFPPWATPEVVEMFVRKISDKKVCLHCKEALTEICVVTDPVKIVLAVFSSLKAIRSPISHEESLRWFQSLMNDFGINAIGTGIKSIAPCLLEECSSSNIKVKREAVSSVAMMFERLGPQFQAMILSLSKNKDVSLALEKAMSERTFDPNSTGDEVRKKCLVVSSETSARAISLDVPKSSLFESLPSDIVSMLGCMEGKAAWKKRKEGLDQVIDALVKCSGLLDTTGPNRKTIVDLARSIRGRLSDTQINLKPLAARALGLLLSKVDQTFQPKLGKLVFGPLILGLMNDIKKPMRAACLEAIKLGTSIADIDGGGCNTESLETLLVAAADVITESSVKAGGLPELLGFLSSLGESLPSVDSVAIPGGQNLGQKFAAAIVECLTSSKSETRAAGSELLENVIRFEKISSESIRKATEKLKPAKQRTVAPLVAKYTKAVGTNAKSLPKTSEAQPKPVAPQERRQASSIANQTPQKRMSAVPHSPGDPTTSTNPLKSRSSSRTSARGIVWPEYPEEPIGAPLFSTFKKAWAQVVSAKSISALFPGTGIRKQDEAQSGCHLLMEAIESDKSEDTSFVLEQFSFVAKWLSLVLCSRETSSGLLSLIDVMKSVLQLAKTRSYQPTDSEVLELFPFVYEKASQARGRFQDSFSEVTSLIESLIDGKTMGTLVCVYVIERSHYAKARVLACNLCRTVVDEIGLSGCGKRGVLATAKALSEDKVQENRQAALDLLLSIFSRMNGEAARLTRICGTNLSDKALQMLQERWRKGNVPTVSSRSTVTLSNDTAEPSAENDDLPPALSLRLGTNEQRQSEGSAEPSDIVASSVFSFSRPLEVKKPIVPPEAEVTDSGGGGAAASLRARLLKIREKSKACDLTENEIPDRITYSEERYEKELNTLRLLMNMKQELEEDDDEMMAAVEILKRLHAALSKQHDSPEYSRGELMSLRLQVLQKLDESVEVLTKIIPFAFDCGSPQINSGISVPLLSVCLASLMALFRDTEVSKDVSQDNIVFLVQQTASSLLDQRLSSSSELDEATANQMVRAINKLAVQGATGAARHTSFMALLTLQLRVARECLEEASKQHFNSRLSRIMSKLLARVIKAEETTSKPFDDLNLDLEALVATMEDTLESCRRIDPDTDNDCVATCCDMVQLLVDAIVSAHGGPEYLKKHLDALGIDREESYVAKIIATHEDEDEFFDANDTPPDTISVVTREDDVASVVAALVNAPQGTDREVALQRLRDYRDTHGDTKLSNHLQKVSTQFRVFIEDQLGKDEAPPPNDEGNSMSERLKNLRSRLQATEIAVQTAVDENDGGQGTPTSKRPSAGKRSTRLAQPSPSRLAAPATGRAAALRARLEAVKQKSQDSP